MFLLRLVCLRLVALTFGCGLTWRELVCHWRVIFGTLNLNNRSHIRSLSATDPGWNFPLWIDIRACKGYGAMLSKSRSRHLEGDMACP